MTYAAYGPIKIAIIGLKIIFFQLFSSVCHSFLARAKCVQGKCSNKNHSHLNRSFSQFFLFRVCARRGQNVFPRRPTRWLLEEVFATGNYKQSREWRELPSRKLMQTFKCQLNRCLSGENKCEIAYRYAIRRTICLVLASSTCMCTVSTESFEPWEHSAKRWNSFPLTRWLTLNGRTQQPKADQPLKANETHKNENNRRHTRAR